MIEIEENEETSPSVEQEFPDHLHPGFHLELPPPDPITLAQNKTPGWDSPWTPRPPAALVARITGNMNGDARTQDGSESGSDDKNLSRHARRRKRIRMYILTNPYVPLVRKFLPTFDDFDGMLTIISDQKLFRFINITFTTAALAIAIRIRAQEMQYHAMGAVGSSPYVLNLNFIFSPSCIFTLSQDTRDHLCTFHHCTCHDCHLCERKVYLS